MTDYWRGHPRVNSRHETATALSRSRNGRPPTGPWYPSVPSWEKKFCTSVCLIPWRKLCETKRMMQYCFQNIVEWDDSAGEEALKNAKSRYWASINGFPCDLSPPDPDMYIDEVDFDCEIDPDLITDLERLPSAADVEDKGEKLDSWDNGWDLNRPVPCTGWGDDPESIAIFDNNQGGGACTGWGNEPECNVINNNNEVGGACNGWEPSVHQPVVSTGWDDTEQPVGCTGWDNADNSLHREAVEPGWGNFDSHITSSSASDNKGWRNGNRWDSGSCNSWENGRQNDSWSGGWERWEPNPNSRNWNSDYQKNRGPWQSGNQKKRGGGGWRNGSRQSSTRFQADDRQINGGGWNSKGRKRSSFIHENPNINKRPLAPSQWHSMRSCGPVTHYGPTQVSSSWRNWEKQVS